MSWINSKSIVTYQDIYDRTYPASNYIFTLNSGQTITGSKKCIRISDAETIISLDPNGIPSGLTTHRLARKEWLIPSAITQQTIFTGFASPQFPGQSLINNKLYYADSSLDGVVYFNPLSITGGTIGTGNTENPLLISMGVGSRPTGAYYNPNTDNFYVNSFYGSGMTIISCSANTIINTIQYGTNSSFSRGNIYLISVLNEVWALGNTGFLRVNATTEAKLTTGAFSAYTPTSAVYATSINNKIYVVTDGSSNHVQVYDTSANLLTTITGLCVNVSNSGNYVSRGFYTDTINNKLYLGEISTTPSINVIDVTSDIITDRFPISLEGKTYGNPSVIAYHPLRNALYVGGGLFNTTTDSVPRLWLFDSNNGITQTVIPSVNLSISSIIAYSYDGIVNVYVGSAGEVPESVPNTAQTTDGIIITFN